MNIEKIKVRNTDTGQVHETGPLVTAPPRTTVGGVGDWPPSETRQRAVRQ